MTSLDTLKQAAQALRDFERVIDEHMYFDEIGTAGKLAAALEAMAEQKPVDYQFQCNGKWCGFINDDHYEDTVRDGRWPIRGLYAAPIATPEHDAKVRDAAIEDCARCADAHAGRPVAGEVLAHAIRYLKTTRGAP